MSATDDLNNPDLFKENPPGVYTYSETSMGKTASGQLMLTDTPQRDPAAQRAAGGEDRRTEAGELGKDDGGHLIGARFGGAADDRNLTPQNSNLNRQDYKRVEESWAARLDAGDKVFVRMESYTGDGSQRPTCYMGYAIIEHTDDRGRTTREIEYYSMTNESRRTHAAWDEAQAQWEADHPEEVEAQRAENTTMEYIWDEDQGKAVKNPYYVAEEMTPPTTAQEQTASEYAPPATAQTQSAGTDYTPAPAAQPAAGQSAGQGMEQ